MTRWATNNTKLIVFQLTRSVWSVTQTPIIIWKLFLKFQLTRSVWSVTNNDTYSKSQIEISTHTLRVERDADIQSPSPSIIKFQLTRSVWSVTHNLLLCTYLNTISTHTLRVERDNLSITE